MSTITSVDLCRSSNRLFGRRPEVQLQHFSSSATLKTHQGFRTNHALLPLTIGHESTTLVSSKPSRNLFLCNSSLPGINPSGSHSWKGWMIGIVISVIIPFWRHKWGPLLALKQEVDMIVDTVEAVVEVVEQVAEKVEDVVDEIGDHLPEGKLKDALERVESLAKLTATSAHLADQLIEQAEAMEDKVEDFFESGLDKAVAGNVIKEVSDETNVTVDNVTKDVVSDETNVTVGNVTKDVSDETNVTVQVQVEKKVL